MQDPRAIYDLSPVGQQSTKLLLSPRKAKRKIPKVPFKVLDAPQLQDDFYLNLVDWYFSVFEIRRAVICSSLFFHSPRPAQNVRESSFFLSFLTHALLFCCCGCCDCCGGLNRSALNVLAVGLGPCVYLWSACTSKVTKLCDLGSDDCVTSVCDEDNNTLSSQQYFKSTAM